MPAGQTTVLVGPSGCGKTTILRMVNRMVEPTAGRVLLDGTDVAELEAAKLRRGIGYVIQQAGLFPHRKVLDNIATVPFLLGWDRRKARARARRCSNWSASTGTAKRYPFQLSGGQQQRVGVARALAADPPLLLMDEPFSAVDPVVRAGLQDELLRLQSELSKTSCFRHARHRGGGPARRPRGAARARRLGQARPRQRCWPPRPTSRWPSSSAATGAWAAHVRLRPAPWTRRGAAPDAGRKGLASTSLDAA